MTRIFPVRMFDLEVRRAKNQQQVFLNGVFGSFCVDEAPPGDLQFRLRHGAGLGGSRDARVGVRLRSRAGHEGEIDMRIPGANGWGLFLLGATLALGFVAASNGIGKALVAMRQDQGIKVKGTAIEDIGSTLGAWTGSLKVRAPTLEAAYRELAGQVAKLRAFVLEAQFAASEVELSSIGTNEVYAIDAQGRRTNVIESYELCQAMTVESPRVAEVERLSREVTALLREGVAIQSGSPTFRNQDIESIKLRLLEQATQNGYQRAETLAKGSGGRVGKLLSASQGVFQIVPRGSTDVSDYGNNDTSSIEKSAKAVVTLEFAVER